MKASFDNATFSVMDPIAKGLILIGVFLILCGAAWHMGWIQNMRIGRLPGDIFIQKENMTLYIPLTTGLLLSVIVSGISYILKK